MPINKDLVVKFETLENISIVKEISQFKDEALLFNWWLLGIKTRCV